MIAPLVIITPVLIIAAVCWLVGDLNDWPWMGVVAGIGAYLAVIITGPVAERRAIRK